MVAFGMWRQVVVPVDAVPTNENSGNRDAYAYRNLQWLTFMVMRYKRRDYSSKIWNEFENIRKRYKLEDAKRECTFSRKNIQHEW